MKKRVNFSPKNHKKSRLHKTGLITFILVSLFIIASLIYISLTIKPEQYLPSSLSNEYALFDPGLTDTQSGQKYSFVWRPNTDGITTGYKIYYGKPYSRVVKDANNLALRNTFAYVDVGNKNTGTIVLPHSPGLRDEILFDPDDYSYGIFAVAYNSNGLESDASTIVKIVMPPLAILSPHIASLPRTTYPYGQEQRFVITYWFKQGYSPRGIKVYETFGETDANGNYKWTEVRNKRRESISTHTYTQITGEDENGNEKITEHVIYIVTESAPYRADKPMHLLKVEKLEVYAMSTPGSSPIDYYSTSKT
jgi:hypothetical protein